MDILFDQPVINEFDKITDKNLQTTMKSVYELFPERFVYWKQRNSIYYRDNVLKVAYDIDKCCFWGSFRENCRPGGTTFEENILLYFRRFLSV